MNTRYLLLGGIAFVGCREQSATEPMSPSSQVVVVQQADREDEHRLAGLIDEAQQHQEKTLETLLERMSLAVAAIQQTDLLGERLAIAELREIVERLVGRFDGVLDSYDEFSTATTLYRRQLEAAAPTLLRAADRFDAYAADESYDSLAQQYKKTAEVFRGVVAKHQRIKGQLADSFDAVGSTLDYARHSHRFLRRLEDHLPCFPDDTYSTREWLVQLVRFTQAFETLQDKLDELHRATASPDQKKTSEATGKVATGLLPEERPQLAESLSSGSSDTDGAIDQERLRPSESPASEGLYIATEQDLDRAMELAEQTDLSGVWVLQGGLLRIRLVPSAAGYEVSLVRSGVVRRVVGSLEARGKAWEAVNLTYHLPGGAVAELRGTSYTLQDADTLKATGPLVRYSQSGGVQHRGWGDYELHRANDLRSLTLDHYSSRRFVDGY